MGLLTSKEAPAGDLPMASPSPKRGKAFRIELGWRGVFGLLVVCFFLFFWMFVFGIWAGQTILLPSRESRVLHADGPVQQSPAGTAAENKAAPQSLPSTDQ